jgi:hypothetical protein
MQPIRHHKCVVPKPKKQKGARIMKKLYVRSVVVVALVVVSSLLIAGVALAGEKWNKWQPIVHPVVVGDFVAYLTPFEDFEEFDNEVYNTICVPQGATGRTSFATAWFEELTGRDLSFVGSDRIYFCEYPPGWL